MAATHGRRAVGTAWLRPPLAPNKWLTLVACCLGLGMLMIDTFVVNVAFPAMMAELSICHDTLQWVSTGFLAATAATMLATAWLVERFGERATFIGALAVLGVFYYFFVHRFTRRAPPK